MVTDKAYREAEKRIAKALSEGASHLDLGQLGLSEIPPSLYQLKQLQHLNLQLNNLVTLPEALAELKLLQYLDLDNNQIATLPDELGKLSELEFLFLDGNRLTKLPRILGQLKQLRVLFLHRNLLKVLPDSLGDLKQLVDLTLSSNHLANLPRSLGSVKSLHILDLDNNPLNFELAAAYANGLEAVKSYLRESAQKSISLNQAKLILIGEGEVGKSCLMDALRGDDWRDHPSTHGIEIKSIKITHPETKTNFTLNAWDFGGQKVYRPTHQLFFTSPAVYLVVWKPREGFEQGAVNYWIETIRHRAGPDAKIVLVATHGAEGERKMDIDLRQLQSMYGADTVLAAFHVENKPDEVCGERRSIAELRDYIVRVAAELPGAGREVPASWKHVLDELGSRSKREAYIGYDEFKSICDARTETPGMADTYAEMFNNLGHVVHYAGKGALNDIIILKPDWLTKAMSFVLEDPRAEHDHGLVYHSRMREIWRAPPVKHESGYADELHDVFRHLMEHFDICYQVALPGIHGEDAGASLIAQLVPESPQDLRRHWPDVLPEDEQEKVQICKIVDTENNQAARAEGLFYRLIVRLHKYSLGKKDFANSCHWRYGLVIDDGNHGRALLEQVGNDVRISVRAVYPEFLLYELTKEVKWLVENSQEGWRGLRCDVMVPCADPCGHGTPGKGLFNVEKLLESRKKGRTEYPCQEKGCDHWQDVSVLLRNATAAPGSRSEPIDYARLEELMHGVVAKQIDKKDAKDAERAANLSTEVRRAMSQAEEIFKRQMQLWTDEAKDGPRLFSFEPLEAGFLDKPDWVSAKFRLTLWCEHSRLPLPMLNGDDDKTGVYEIDLPKEWLKKSAPVLKTLSRMLGLILPVAAQAAPLALDEAEYNSFREELDLGEKCAQSLGKSGEHTADWVRDTDESGIDAQNYIRGEGATLRHLHELLRKKDPGFGGLVRVKNKRHEFLWVHDQFREEYM